MVHASFVLRKKKQSFPGTNKIESSYKFFQSCISEIKFSRLVFTIENHIFFAHRSVFIHSIQQIVFLKFMLIKSI